MNRIIKFLKKNYRWIYAGISFLITGALIIYLFPNEGKFPYEYQKGKPWMHETLIAQSGFPIVKTENELQAERDSILKGFAPYYDIKTEASLGQQSLFDSQFESYWDSFVKRLERENFAIGGQRLSMLKDFYHDSLSVLIDKVYRRGIVESYDMLNESAGNSKMVKLLNKRISEDRKIEDIFTPKSAYEFIQKESNRMGLDIFPEGYQSNWFFKEFDLNNYLSPNLSYNEELSLQERKNLLDQVSLTRGMVQRGERIISKGDKISHEKFILLESMRAEYESALGSETNYYLIGLGQALIVIVCFVCLFFFLYNFRKEVLLNLRKLLFILLMILLSIIGGLLAINSNTISLYIIPFAILPIIINTFYDARLALFIHIITIFLIGFYAPNGFEFMLLQFVAGVFAIFSMANLHRRAQLVFSAIIVSSCYSVIYVSISLIHEGTLRNIDWMNLLWFLANGFLVLFTYPLIYIFEKVFGFLSDVTLIELSDTNHPLLRKLAEQAPGTFQHSMQVSNLAEEVVRKIGGNSLLVRVGALYHDVGKIKNPPYFTENQVGEMNPHENLKYEESARIIISHISDGVEIARKFKIPDKIVDFIVTHQGTTKAKYFYKNYIRENGTEHIDEAVFTYPGPVPFSKETAILMMADSVEAASRSLKKYTEENIDKIVEEIINQQIKEGQFEQSEITFKDIFQAKEVFKNKLRNIYHTRIQYPK